MFCSVHESAIVVANLLYIQVIFTIDVRLHRTVATGYLDDTRDVLKTRHIVDLHLHIKINAS